MGITATVIRFRLIIALVVVVNAATTESCDSIAFECDNGQCILATKMCDGEQNCRDGSDESKKTCGDDCGGYGYKCANGQCVFDGYRHLCHGRFLNFCFTAT